MHKKIFVVLGSVIVLMYGFAYASVPLYRLFCQVTGYGGTPHISNTLATTTASLTNIHVRLETNLAHNLPWTFHPLPPTELNVTVGEPVLAFYHVCNDSSAELHGIATYNILPQEAAIYFNKIQCFCFEEQKLAPHETIELPVLFFIHPDILHDSFRHVTLAYTFFPSST